MSEPGKAVFLSYASQDAEAAQRICETLRAAGVEVWFDTDGGLEHGDEWDRKIRRQIKECVLFLPIISANTQAREEGYFRIEWELAAERAMGIASGVVFILPIVIDDTRESAALVPDRFRKVQWTRLPGGEIPPDVRARFLKLWSHRAGVVSHQAMEPGRPRPGERGEGAASPAQPGVGRPLRGRLVGLVGAAAALTLLGSLGWKFLHRGAISEPPPEAVRRSAPPTAENSAGPQTEARQLVAKAWEQMNKPGLARAELEIAAAYCKQAAELDPNSAAGWAAWSQVDSWMVYHNFDASPARREAARTKAARAMQLSPNSFEARLARACQLVRGEGPDSTVSMFAPEADRLLRTLLQEKPDEPRTLFALGILLRNTGAFPECREILGRMAKNPVFAAQAWNELGWAEYIAGDNAAAGIAIARSIALQAYWGNLTLKVGLAQWWLGDLDLAQATLDQIPAASRQEDIGVCESTLLAHWRREPEVMLRILHSVPRDWLQSNAFAGPKAWYAGLAHQMAGHEEAARVQWRTALKLVEQRLVDQPDSGHLLRLKGRLLAAMGNRAEAETALRLAREMGDKNYSVADAGEQVLLGNLDAAMTLLERAVDERARFVTAATYRLNPLWDPLREQPRFKALLARMEADPRFSPNAPEKPAAAAAVAPDAKSVAVLAFANLSDDKANEYFSDGISEELLTVLQKIPGLHVAARTSAFFFKGKNATAQEIGEKLGVATLVEGSVRKSGNSVRITARLSRAATGEQLWSESYTRDLKDVFAVQTELAQTIVEQLRGQLGGTVAKAEIQAQVQAAEKGGTENAEAHRLYLQGKFFANQFSQENLAKAAGFFQRAVALDPAFAQAWAAWARVSAKRGEYGNTVKEWTDSFAQARQAIDRALALEPNLAEAQTALMEIQVGYDFDWRGARESVRRALSLAPSDAMAVNNAALLAGFLGEMEKSVALGRQAAELDPINPEIHHNLANNLAILGRFQEAAVEHRRALELSPSMPDGHGRVARELATQGKLAEALAEAELEQIELARLTALAKVQWDLKNPAKAEEALKHLIDSGADVCAYQIAEIYAHRRENDRAFQWLERAYRQHDSGLVYTKTDVDFTTLHDDPRWDAFLHKLGLADDQLK